MIEKNTIKNQKESFEILRHVLHSENAKILDVQEPAFIRARHGYWYSFTPRNISKILAVNVVPSGEGAKVTITTSLASEIIGVLSVAIVVFALAIILPLTNPEMWRWILYLGVIGFIALIIYGVWFAIDIDKFAKEMVRPLPQLAEH